MGNGHSLTVSGAGDRADLHAAIWDKVRETLEMYLNSTANRAALDYLDEAIAHGETDRCWGAHGDQLSFVFDDFAGCCSRSSNLWSHWLGIGLVLEWDAIGKLAADHDLQIADAPRTLVDALSGSSRFAKLRDDLWSVDATGLFGDDRHVELAALTEDERALHARALERCRCSVCTLIVAEPDTIANLVRGLDGSRSASSAAWYLVRMRDATPDILDKLIGSHGPLTSMMTVIETYADRVGKAATWDAIGPRLDDARGSRLGFAMYALAQTVRDDADRARLVAAVRKTLAGDDEVAITAAAEVAGRIGRGEPELGLEVGRLLDRESLDDETRHATMLGLVNLSMPPNRMLPPTRERVKREAARGDTKAAKLAKWLDESF